MTTVGVFDSGVGGLSVLRALLAEGPEAQFVYLADSAFAPYGERSAAEVQDRCERITRYLRQQHHIDALVVACNTATALAIDSLRLAHPDLPIVGVEPALKPAAELSVSGHVGVLATRATLASPRFAALRQRLEVVAQRPLHFTCQPCDGLADAIERDDEPRVQALCQRYLNELAQSSQACPTMDTLVLGCTHYPFAASHLQALCGPAVSLVETGPAVARRTRTLLDPTPGNPSKASGSSMPSPTLLLTTGSPRHLGAAASRWLGSSNSATPVVI